MVGGAPLGTFIAVLGAPIQDAVMMMDSVFGD